MSKSFRKDLTGQRFGRLTVIEFVPNNKKNSFWRCKCDCGKETILRIQKKTKSCGCERKEVGANNGRKALLKHGKRKTRLYTIWAGIKYRCNNPHCAQYKDYGGRGITICESWQNNFEAFYEWAMSNGYSDDLTIDRIDNNKGYSPENCRFTTRKIQNRNKRDTIMIDYNGKIISLHDAAEQTGISYGTLQSRYYKGDRGKLLFRQVTEQQSRKKKKS